MFLPSNITLKFGDSGDFVSELQRRLAAVKAHSADAISGYFDGITVNSVSGFQARSGLIADGIAGPETLRRLNGLISGDTSGGTSDKKEDDVTKQLTQEAMMRSVYGVENQAVGPLPAVAEAVMREAEVVVAAAAVAETVTAEPAHAMPHTAPIPAMAPEQIQAQQQLQMQQQMQQMQQQASLREAPMPVQEHVPPAPPHAAPAIPASVPSAAAHTPPPVAHAPMPSAPPHVAAPPVHPTTEAAHTPAAPVAAPEQARGLIGRAMQKVDAFVQKMAEYFEAKLPPDVLREVQKLGQVMAQSGVREIPIPTGPEQIQAPSLPSRGPEQQPHIQRG